MFKVLSIDGGGIRGVIPARLLVELEALVGCRTAEMFDLIVGTSTGGILAAGLAVDAGHGKAPYAADALLELYVERGGEIFSRSMWQRVASFEGLADEKYPAGNLEKILEEYLGDAALRDVQKPVVLTAYEIEERAPYFFKTGRAGLPGRDHRLCDACRATSAAPTYFEPARVTSIDEARQTRSLVDGGVFVNNPGMCAYAEAIEMGNSPGDILVVSLGTGIATRPILYEDAKDWGPIGWVQPIIGIMMDGSADAADFQLRQLLPGADAGTGQRYFRFDKELTIARDDLDDASRGNIRLLQDEAASIIDAEAAALKRLVPLLRRGTPGRGAARLRR